MLDYEALYEAHAAGASSDAEIVGAGPDFDRVGAVELAALSEAGLQPTDTLVDFGCGVGRLALHAVPFLNGGHYIGIEISPLILQRAEEIVTEALPHPSCQLTWLHNTETAFPLADESVDIVCAFSVFTHMEHEDSYRYLVDALRIVRPRGRLVFSCLPLDSELAKKVFVVSATLSLAERWGGIRNFATSRDLMDQISMLAGWRVVAWYSGDEGHFSPPGWTEPAPFGQWVCVLEKG